MSNELSIIYSTSRKQPKFEWFVEYLVEEYKGEVTDEIIFSDVVLFFDPYRREKLKQIVDGRFEYIHLMPKPSMWYGPYKKTPVNFFDASSTRNSGIIASTGNHIVFVDDLSIPCSGWIQHHKKAGKDGIVLAGLYDKVYDIQVEKNKVVGFNKKTSFIDGRVNEKPSEKVTAIGGGWCFTGNLSVPKKVLEKVDGFDEFYARHGCEDCDFGVRLKNAGVDIFLNKECKLYEDQHLHWNGENAYTREIGGASVYRGYKSDLERSNTFFKEWSEKIYGERMNQVIKNKITQPMVSTNLVEQKSYYKTHNMFMPLTHFLKEDYDGQPISQI